MMGAVAGLALTAVVSVVVALVWGGDRSPAAAVFGLVATAVHVVAVRLLAGALEPPYEKVLQRWAAGLALRLVAVAFLGAAVVLLPETFDPLPTVAGFLGVLLPLLAGEMRLVMQRLRKPT